jgi:glycosyltransferase involved in cell wall biosynthesis
LEWFIGQVAVVHGTNFVVPPTGRAGAIASVHDLTPLHHPELCNQATLAYPGLIRRAIARGAWIHTDSAFVAGEVMDAFAVDPSRVRVVAPGVPLLPDVGPDVGGRLVEPWLPSDCRRYILAVGTAEPRKDLPGLVRAFDELADKQKDLALVLAGPPGWGEAPLSEAIARATSRSRIVQTGWVDDRLLAALLGQASVLAYPSRYEGFGFPPLQAMRAGVAVVATRAGSLPEVLGDGAYLIDVGDHDGLVGALGLILADEDLRQQLVEAGRARVADFDWEACGAGLEEMYRNVAGSS